ncbi:oligoendopeptidase F [Anaeromyxobacter paludicola]|uniref:Oligopeptidase F n=1 Tax=Anaeromyxobacter paludicola TaxID=2918171 RepID=A0ABM7XCB1_9BACT|nr:oligoendopeptidase F [Anaeromyxobacter paludicola]BDG09511.1 oligoendopeptidase F [Anaeromyxobacter paludicola]
MTPSPPAAPRAALRLLAALALCLAALPAGAAAVKDRSQIPEQYKWNLADIFPSAQAWAHAKAELGRRLPALARHKGHLGDSAAALLAGLDDVYGFDRELQRVSVYASTLSDEDTRAAKPREMKQSAELLQTDFAAATAWVKPELQSLDPARVRAFLAQEPKLAPYRFFVEDALRWKPHTLSAPEERIVAQAGILEGAGGAAYNVLKDADLPYPTVKLSTGEEVRLDNAAFTLHREARSRADRELVFREFFGALQGYERTMGATLYANVQAHLFDEKVHRFGSALEAALFPGNIPPEVYRQLLRDVRRSLPTLHRYLKLRQRMLGVSQLEYQDLYVPLVKEVALSYTPDQARAVTLEALAPLGRPYRDALQRGFESRWTDYLPTPGKRTGAYSTGVYGVHPYQLLNFNGTYEDLSTLAHESGHSMHTWLSMNAQPYPTADYPIFVAEVASTLNENLLVHHLLAKAKDDDTRLFLLGSNLDGLRTTLFRQALFAEFELRIHEQVEQGETLTGEGLSALYLKLVREYYGHDQGVCRVDDLARIEWAYIPHFYYDFYVWQYATSMVASTALATGLREEARQGGTSRRDAYLDLLRAGGSRYPIDLLASAGVDMRTSKPFDAAIAEMNATMDEIERILARRPARAAP